MSRFSGDAIGRKGPGVYSAGPGRGWLILCELADGTWRVLMRGGFLHVFSPQVVEDPEFPWTRRDPSGLVYTTDGRHEVLDASAAHAQGVPGVPIRRIVPLDLSRPHPWPFVDDDAVDLSDRDEFWVDRRMVYYKTPLTPPDMRFQASGIVHLVSHPSADWFKMAFWPGTTPESIPPLRDFVLSALKEVELVLWHNDLYEAAVRGSDVFMGTAPTVEDIPTAPQLWMFAQPYWLNPSFSEKHEDTLAIGGACLLEGYFVFPAEARDGKGLLVGMIMVRPGSPVVRYEPVLRFLRIADRGHPIGWPVNEVMAACRLMRLPLAGREVHRLPRQQRRALEREGRPPQDVQVIVLRRELAPREEQERDGGVDWSCHWLVKGHWRQQWHPSLGEHRPIYIDAHLKGDFSKPFRPPRQKLYVVAR
jgi:hypothetical protein